MIGTRVSIARLTADPSVPDELSTCSSAGDSRSIRRMAPSAAVIGSLREADLISATASLIRAAAVGEDLQEKVFGRMRLGNCHLWAAGFLAVTIEGWVYGSIEPCGVPGTASVSSRRSLGIPVLG